MRIPWDEDDPNDELKGYALQAVWPARMTAAELFAALTPAKRQHFRGAYQRFLSSHFMRQLRSADLPIALKWVEERVSRGDGRYRYSILFPIADDILLESWKHLDTLGVPEALARVIILSLERFEVVEDQDNHELIQLVDDDSKRRQVLASILHEFSQRQSDQLLLFDYKPRLLFQRDVLWLLEHLLQAETDSLQKVVARLVGRMVNINDVELVYTVSTACQSNSYLAAEFSWLFQAVKLGSPEAERMKEAYLREKQHEDHLQELAQRANSPSLERIATLLDECERDNIFVWDRVYWELAYRPDGSLYNDEFNREVFPGWAIANEAIRARMIKVATQYVQSFEPGSEDWLGTDSIPFSTLVAYQTLQLLSRETPSFISALGVAQWAKFVPIILTWCVPEDVSVDRDLLKLSYRAVPEVMIRVMTLLIERQGKLSHEPQVIQKVESCWDDHLPHALLEKVKDEELELECLECLLRTLLQHHLNEAREFALALVARPLLEEREKMRALIAAKLLLRYAVDAGWSVVWAAIQRNEDFGMKLVAKFAQSFSDWVPPQLTEDQLADLYIWLVRRYPPSQYPIVLEASFAGVADSIALWRDALLSALKNRATFQACEAIQRISREVPELDQFSLRWTLQEAQKLARRQMWKPFQPRDILKIGNDSQVRLVQSGEHLLEAVIESLKRLEAKFHDELPAWREVWDLVPPNPSEAKTKGKVQSSVKYRPIDENEFSNYVVRHLKADLKARGIVANREVVISKSERTDIHVDAIVRNSPKEVYDSVSVIIEVKGCWNEELYTAMKAQLVDRYLEDNHCRYGLYLIGWFNCDAWEVKGDNRYRKSKTRHEAIDEVRKQFDTRAAELSHQGLTVRALVLDASVHR